MSIAYFLSNKRSVYLKNETCIFLYLAGSLLDENKNLYFLIEALYRIPQNFCFVILKKKNYS